jgi:hypothetical protein
MTEMVACYATSLVIQPIPSFCHIILMLWNHSLRGLWKSEWGRRWKSAESTPISLIFPYSQGFLHLEAFKEF